MAATFSRYCNFGVCPQTLNGGLDKQVLHKSLRPPTRRLGACHHKWIIRSQCQACQVSESTKSTACGHHHCRVHLYHRFPRWQSLFLIFHCVPVKHPTVNDSSCIIHGLRRWHDPFQVLIVRSSSRVPAQVPARENKVHASSVG
jgi:hypothetical protein